MIQIYHNPRCSKSRLGVEYLKEKNKEFEIIKYLNEVPTKSDLISILTKLGYTPIQLVRKTEKIWKEKYKGKEMSDSEIIEAMIENPKLIERPIIINGEKAVVARPTEKISEVI